MKEATKMQYPSFARASHVSVLHLPRNADYGEPTGALPEEKEKENVRVRV